MSGFVHIPIMLKETLALLTPERGGVFIDGTLGGGGHAEAVLERLPNGSRLYGIDRDMEAIEAAKARLAPFSDKFFAVHGNFHDMKALLNERGEEKADGILLDLGVSSHQLDERERGFSYIADAALDMRMDASSPFSARDVVNGYAFEELARVIREYGEERFAGKIAAAIVRERAKKPIETTLELADIIRAAMPAASRREAQHPAKRTFQAIRIEVNGELEGLGQAIVDAHDMLRPSGVLAIITFHSLEDRIVKQSFRAFEHPCTCDPHAPICTCGRKPTAETLTKKPITASKEELDMNPRARSAKLRAIRKLGGEDGIIREGRE